MIAQVTHASNSNISESFSQSVLDMVQSTLKKQYELSLTKLAPDNTKAFDVTCHNVTHGGEIAGIQVGCGTFDASDISNVTLPSGGSGALEYLWIKTTDPTLNVSLWSVVPGADGPSYSPGVITETTYFIRCSRREGCTAWDGESNVIFKAVNPIDPCPAGEMATLQSGNALSVFSNNGVTDASHALGAPDGDFAQFYDEGDYFYLDMGQDIPAGATYTIVWKYRNYDSSFSGPSELDVKESANGSSFTFNTTISTTVKSFFIASNVTAQSTFRYLKLKLPKDVPDAEVDAVYYCFNECDSTPPTDPPPSSWNYLCLNPEGNKVDCSGTGVKGETSATLNFTDVSSMSYIIVEAISKGGTPVGNVIFTTPNETVNAMAESVSIAPNGNNCSSCRVYRAQLDPASSVTLNTNGSTNIFSLVAYVIREGITVDSSYSAQLDATYFYRGDDSFTLPISTTSSSSRKIVVKIPVTELSNDSRIIRATATAGSVSETVEANVWDSGLGESLRFLKIMLNDVPGSVSSVTVNVSSPDSNGDSFLINGVTASASNCTDCTLDANAGNDVTICEGESTTLTASGSNGTPPYSFSWSNGLGSNASVMVDPTSTTTYTVTVTDADGCEDTDQVTVTVNPLPTATIACAEGNNTASYTLLNQSCDGNNDRVFWAGSFANGYGGGNNWVAEPGATFIEKNDGSASLVMTTKNQNNNDLILNFNVTFFGKTTTPPSGSPVTGSDCGTLDPTDWRYYTSFSGTITGGGDLDGANFSISNTGPAFQVGPGASLKTNPGVLGASGWIGYVINSQPNSGSGLPSDSQMDFNFALTENPSDCSICAGETATLTASGSGGTGPYTYSWSNSLGTGESVTVDPTTTTTYTVTVTDANSCENTADITVIVYPQPEVDLGNDVDICDGEDITITANVTGGTGPFSYLWSNNATTPSITVAPTQNTTYSVTVTDANGCEDHDDIHVTTNANLTVNVNNAEICDGQSATLTAMPVGGSGTYTYQWSNGLGTNPSITVSPGSNMTYSVTVMDSNGCSGTGEGTVVVNPNPNADAGDDVEICAGNSTDLSASGSGGTPGYTYEWSDGLGSGPNKTVSPNSTKTYTVTVTDSKGCYDTDHVTVTVNPNPTVSVNDDEICAGQTASLTADPDGGTPPYSYAWSNGLGSDPTVTPSPGTTTTYTVTITDSKNCTVTGTGTVTVNPNPTADAGDDVEICAGFSTDLSASANGGTPGYSYEWSDGLGSGPDKTVSPNSTKTYTVTVTDSKGCHDTDQVTVTVNPNPTVSVNDDEICAGEMAALTANPSGGTPPYTFAWSDGLGSNQTVMPSPGSTTSYTVTVTDNKGCIATASGTVTVNPNPDVSISIDNDVSCNGNDGSLTANPSGGTHLLIPSFGVIMKRPKRLPT